MANVTVVWKDPNDEGRRAVWICSDGVVGVGEDTPTDSGEPEWSSFTPYEWCTIVEATRDVWERVQEELRATPKKNFRLEE